MPVSLRETFEEMFGQGKELVSARAPGRTNLIGEHVDYQGGQVLPFAVDRYVTCLGKKRPDQKIRLYSVNYQQSFETNLSEISFQKDFPWANYILGVVEEFKKLGCGLAGFEAVVAGDIPVASGLSSSASLEICMAVFLMKTFGISLPNLDVIKLARRAENVFVGVNCGIMDQFSIYLCRKEHALLLDCKTLKYRPVPLKLGKYRILLVDTRKERKLSELPYNERVAQVNQAVQVARQKGYEIEFLADLKLTSLHNLEKEMEPVVYRRALHVVQENQRVLEAVRCLEERDWNGLGRLLYLSHHSLKDLYEVSCPELDFVVNFSKDFPGVCGARLTGAGFGGCCLALVQEENVPAFQKELRPQYEGQFGWKPEFYQVNPVDGALSSSGIDK